MLIMSQQEADKMHGYLVILITVINHIQGSI